MQHKNQSSKTNIVLRWDGLGTGKGCSLIVLATATVTFCVFDLARGSTQPGFFGLGDIMEGYPSGDAPKAADTETTKEGHGGMDRSPFLLA